MNEKKERVVLAYGEVTGHAHAFYEPVKVIFKDGKLEIKESGALLEHEEHTTHDFDIGTGEVTIQREYQMGSLKRVVDWGIYELSNIER